MKNRPIFFSMVFFLFTFLMSEKSFGEFRENKLSMRISGGMFQPFEGKSGFVVNGGLDVPALPQVILGGELEYRQFETTLLEVSGVDVKAISLHLVGKYLFFPKGVTPYVGGGFSSALNIVETNKIERERPGVDVFNEVGFGSGLFGLVGILVPITPHITFFGEGRGSFDFQITNVDQKTEFENLGGGLGVVGIYVHL